MKQVDITNPQSVQDIEGRGAEGLQFDDGFVEITHEEWELRFKPTEVLSIPEDTDPLCVWGEFECDDPNDGWAIHSGRYRGLGNYISPIPFPEGVLIQVWTPWTWSTEEVEKVRLLLAQWQRETGSPSDAVVPSDFREWCYERDPHSEDYIGYRLHAPLGEHFPDINIYYDLDDCPRAAVDGGDDNDK